MPRHEDLAFGFHLSQEDIMLVGAFRFLWLSPTVTKDVVWVVSRWQFVRSGWIDYTVLTRSRL